MATTRSGEPEPAPTRRERAEDIAREVIAGHPDGAVRRILLYSALAGNLMGLAILTGHPLGIAMAVLAAVALVLLLATDGGL